VKPLAALLVLAGSLVVASPVRAETVSTRLTPKKTGDHLYSFAIKVERLRENDTGEFLEFHVTVKPTKAGKAARLPRRSGRLDVYAAKKELVVSCEVQPTGRDDEVSYSFRVSAKHLGHATFTFAETAGEAEFGGFYYWFYLADFAPSLPAGGKDKKNTTDDERAKLLKPEMTFKEISELWSGKKSLGQTCGEGVNKLTGETGGAYGEVYEWKPAGTPKLSSLKVGYFQGEDQPYEVRGPGFQYSLKGGKYVAVRPVGDD
jgi:hypothetical protein